MHIYLFFCYYIMTFKVERESVDLVDKTLAKYNKGLLRLAGVLSRIIYENELEKIFKFLQKSIWFTFHNI